MRPPEVIKGMLDELSKKCLPRGHTFWRNELEAFFLMHGYLTVKQFSTLCGMYAHHCIERAIDDDDFETQVREGRNDTTSEGQ